MMKMMFCFHGNGLFLYTLAVASLSSVMATNSSCPTWHYYNNLTGQCECGYDLICCSDGNKVEIANGKCATSSEKEGDYYIGDCSLWHPINSTNRTFSEMPSNASELDEVMCGPYNRRGLLCGECIEGYGLPVYSLSLKCVNCSNLHLSYSVSLYLLIQIIPSTLVFVFFVVFRVNVTGGPFLGYILYCQGTLLTLTYGNTFFYEFVRSNSPFRPLLLLSVTLSQFWNLQLFKTLIPPFCVSEELTRIHLYVLGLIPAIHQLFLVVVLCILMELYARNCRIVGFLWKPFSWIISRRKMSGITYDAVFHAFGSAILFSSFSVLLSAQYMVGDIDVHNSTGHLQRRVSYLDPTIDWSHQRHIITLGIIIITCVAVIPSFILCIYPTRMFRYLLGKISTRKQLAITAFVEALNSSFKDGLNGSRDYRAMAGGPPILGFLYSGIKKFLDVLNADHALEDIIVIMSFACVVAFIKPFKTTVANASLVFHLILAAIVECVIHMWRNYSSVKTQTLELTLITLLLFPHLLLALHML